MQTTPILGLEYAEGDDPAKQYPVAVDQPSKQKIEDAIEERALRTDLIAPFVHIGYTGGSYPAGLSTLVGGGILSRGGGGPDYLYDPATGVITVPLAGIYIAGSWAGVDYNMSCQVGLGNVAGTKHVGEGSLAATGAEVSVNRSVCAGPMVLDAGEQCRAWVTVYPNAGPMHGANSWFRYLGPINP
jgi:hypothetical protein